jgi:hypothetical protein
MNHFYQKLNYKNQGSYNLETKTNLDISSSYFIKGLPDSGKTTLALQIAKSWINETGISDKINFVSSLRVTELLRSWYSAKTSSQESDKWRYEYESYRDSLCLIIDDFGKEKVTEFVFEKWYELLNFRNENGLQTIFTSNETLETIAKNFDDSVRSRIIAIVGLSNIIELEYQGWRAKSEGNKTNLSELRKQTEILETKTVNLKPKRNRQVEISEAIKAMMRGYTQAKKHNNPNWEIGQSEEISRFNYYQVIIQKYL